MLWYVIINIIVPIQYPGYDIASQTVSVPPPAAITSRWCIGGQKNPKTESTKITTATIRNLRFPLAENQTPNAKARNKIE